MKHIPLKLIWIYYQLYKIADKKMIRVSILAMVMLVSLACDQNHELPPDLVAQVNDAYLIKDNLNYRLSTDLYL